ncbi:UFD1-domain-containing protein [Ceraceosorus guamensis]|uniref:UFD1-domain-containing protein n=1 Tax=Ceraceosorus guamensis TaxID=1522189 RepID=A0A316VMT4_9BASI|nr:UFD1-domain-containing protein [Ceraceosorus guamensis]PWN38892.1 UFD1-domain-containing protein [Ceraceosorus guamensis]
MRGFGAGAGGAGAFGAFGDGGDDDDDPRFSRPPHHYDEYFKAYSTSMLPGKERLNVSYGGKIMMPTSALARLSHLGIQTPWLFELSSTGTAADGEEYKTHAGVLEFIADEGNVHLPAWMMRQLHLSEGDPIRVRGKSMPQGKHVKIQPQTVDFLEIADPKGVLEGALSNFSALTKGDIIEISYNCLTFEILVLEIKPDAESINITETDLEVDFAPPKGYVEPAPKPRAPIPTMASKLNIDKSKVDSIPASGATTPGGGGSGSGREGGAGGAEERGAFRGAGQSLSGKKPKAGKKDKPIEQPDAFSKIRRTDQVRFATNDTQLQEKQIPAALNLPFGRLFFGYEYEDPGAIKAKAEQKEERSQSFAGSGTTLSGRAPAAKSREENKEKENVQQQQQQQQQPRRLDGRPIPKVVEISDDEK